MSPWMATAADSGNDVSLVGPPTPITSHTRHQVILAYSRLRRHYIFDILAQDMMDNHYKFHMQFKVTMTMTKLVKNFKAFMLLGTQVELLPYISEATADLNVEGVDDVNMYVDSHAVDVEEVKYISVDAIVNESSWLNLSLLVNMKCTDSAFNKLASVAADKALDSTSFRLTNRKAQRLWNL